MIEVVRETARGCGFRKAGAGGVGIYLVGSVASNCGLLPAPLHMCPVCGGGIRQSRGVAWVKPGPLFLTLREPVHRCKRAASECINCPMGNPPDKALLMWVGKQFYPTTRDFALEAHRMGISKRLGALPRDFVPGETLVYLAHPLAVQPWDHLYDGAKLPAVELPEREYPLLTLPVEEVREPAPQPGVFMAFRPTIELVIETEEVPAYASAILSKFGPEAVRIVRIEPILEAEEEQASLDW